MPLATFLHLPKSPQPRAVTLQLAERQVALIFVRNPRARRYILRIRSDGVARVTVPRGGSLEFAFEFAQRQTAWIERQLLKPLPNVPETVWQHGTEILFRGGRVTLTAAPAGDLVQFADQVVVTKGRAVRSAVERQLARLAVAELPARTRELAAMHGVAIGRVTIRNQRSRWGSCSVRGAISLNWRLIQTPPSVRDYIILHELMHTREMNHSGRFWAQVELVCPEWREAERWLRKHGNLLRA